MSEINILDQIGRTPLLKLRKVIDNPDVDIYVKCEYLNPSGSVKDRMALRMVEEAEKSGRLKRGGTIVEQSTGNTGPALAFVGAVKGYKVKLFMPTQLGSSYDAENRIRIAKLFGCEVEPVDLDAYLEDVERLTDVEKAAAFVAIRMKQCNDLVQSDPTAWWANQLCNMDNALANRDTTGKEIVDQLGGKIIQGRRAILWNVLRRERLCGSPDGKRHERGFDHCYRPGRQSVSLLLRAPERASHCVNL